MAVWSEIAISRSLFDRRLDPEFYQSKYLENEKRLNEKNSMSLIALGSDVRCGPFGSAIMVDDYCHEGIPFIRVADTSDIFLKTDNLIFLKKEKAKSLTRYEVEPGDIVVSQRGTLAQFAIVPSDHKKWIISANLISLKVPKNLEPYYLIAFLNSEIGISQLERLQSGQVQPKIITDDIKHLLIYLPSPDFRQQVSTTIEKSKERQDEAKALLAQAEGLLLSELCLGNLDLSPSLFYERPLSETQQIARIDAEFFQPKYYRLRERLNACSFRNVELNNLIAPIKNGYDYREFGEEGLPYIRVGDISNGRLDIENAKRVNIKWEDIKKDIRLKKGDVLLTRKGSYGNAAYVREGQTDCVISSEIMLLRILDSSLLPEYLTVYLNSPIGFQQVERFVHGDAFYSISQPSLASVRVIMATRQIQEKIAALVRKADTSRDESRRLLAEAKRMVEEAVLARDQ
ncbi:MAG: restriction endonuclease subunit S [Dehalococcoidia bacterium]